MTIFDAYNRAMTLCGYVNQDGVIDNDNSNPKILAYGNAVLNDMGYESVNNSNVKLPFHNENAMKLNECFVYGLAMWVAISNNDGNMQQFMVSMYDKKKSSCNKQYLVQDTFLRGYKK